MIQFDKRYALAFGFVVLLMGITVVAGVIVTETPENVGSSEEKYEDGEHSDQEEGVNLQNSPVAWWMMHVQEYNTSREYTNPDPTGQKGSGNQTVVHYPGGEVVESGEQTKKYQTLPDARVYKVGASPAANHTVTAWEPTLG